MPWFGASHACRGRRYRLLGKLDFLVVQDLYPTTETARRAHLYLPGAGWGEKEGTLINSERRLGLVKKVSRAPGLALADFHIFRLVAESWGCGGMFRRWQSPEAAFQVLKELSRGRPCDISGIRDYRMIEEWGGIQWPLPEGSPLVAPGAEADARTHRRLFADGTFYHADGRARLLFDPPRSVPEPPDAEFPLVLLTGRGTSAQWHTGSRTNKSSILRGLAPTECYLEISPADARTLGVGPNTQVQVSSRRGSLVATALVTSVVQPGQVFLPMHYPEVNQLTHPGFDPHSRQPSYKHCAVRVEAIAR